MCDMIRNLGILMMMTLIGASAMAQNSLPPLTEGKVAQNVDELWAGYDPRAEPLDVEIIHEWDETYQGKAVKVQMLTFTVGTFKGEVSRIAAYYATPADATGKVPGLVQIVAGLHRLPGEPKTILSGGTWPGTRELRNLRWTGGAYTAPLLYPGGKLSAEEFQKIFQEDIDKSIELEEQDANK